MRRRILLLAALAALLVIEDIGILMLTSRPGRMQAAFRQTYDQTAALSFSDLSLYRAAFEFEQAGQSDRADTILARVEDPLLKGVLLGERYLGQNGDPSFSEIALWLARYGDHAQARALYRMARHRAPDEADFLTEPRLAMFKAPDVQERSMLFEQKHWVSGIAAFRKQDMHRALGHFRALLENNKGLSSEDRAAAAFWAHRVAMGLSDTAQSAKYLGLAEDQVPCFYSILARQVALGLASEAQRTEDMREAGAFMRREPIRRVIALKNIGQEVLAEKELKALSLAAGTREERARLSQFAQVLGLAARTQLAVIDTIEESQAHYPVPRWKPTLGYHVEPALLFAIMRQESGFNPNAKSPSGALGVMQLMPATASAMARDARMKPSIEPAVSMALGQRYLEHLMQTSSISDNLIFVLAAYNAGPGNVAAWQKNLRVGDDPLLFIESIPNAQTRDYVVRVMNNYWVYSEMLGGQGAQSAEALSEGRWPRYERSEQQMASVLSRLDASGVE